MAAYSGRPVLAGLGPESLPQIEFSIDNLATVTGLRDGWTAVMDLAVSRLPDDDPFDREFYDRIFNERVHDARTVESYEYSRAFLAGAHNALDTLRTTTGGEG